MGEVNKSLIQLVSEILESAVENGASSLTFTPGESQNTLTYSGVYSPRLRRAISSRLKILGGMSISESGRQTSQIDNYELGGESYQLKFTSSPTKYGEKIKIDIKRRKA